MLNVAGHRIGTMEVESALVDHPKVAEAAVVGRPHELKGQAVAAFVTLKEGVSRGEALVDELKEHVVQKIGAIARPDDIIFTADLPKTRSGKIMRRLLRDIAEGKALGDTTTLADPAVVAQAEGAVRGRTLKASAWQARSAGARRGHRPARNRPEPGRSRKRIDGTDRNPRPLEDLRDGRGGDPRPARGLHPDRARRIRGDHGAVRVRASRR